MGFNAKNLSYVPTEPAFLRRLRNEHGSGDSGRHEFPLRQTRHRVEDDEDDLPAYVDGESRNTISKSEYDALLSHAQEHKKKDAAKIPVAINKDSGPAVPSKQQEANIGGNSKKRQAKVIAERPEDGDSSLPDNGKFTKIRKKKAKEVKLSFDSP